MNRLEQKSDLLIKLGGLFGPLLKLVEAPEQYNEQEKAETLARYFAEHIKFWYMFNSFCQGQPGHDYALESAKCSRAIYMIKNYMLSGATLESVLDESFQAARSAIDAVPVPATSVILEAGSPFTAYCRLRELCEVDATSSLVWLDPYMSADIFHRYITAVRETVPITLVTSEPDSHTGGRNKTRWNEFLDISRLFAVERGAGLYTLIVQPNLHDRWVVFDKKRIYALGGSAKDAAQKDYFTIATIEQTPANLQSIQSQISSGAEFFGVNSPTHQ